jgi:hypothetical protein
VRALAGTDAYVHARRRRQRIERVFGHLKRNLGLRTLKLRGLSGATEEFTMAAAAYDLELLDRQAAPARYERILRRPAPPAIRCAVTPRAFFNSLGRLRHRFNPTLFREVAGVRSLHQNVDPRRLNQRG